MKPQFRILYIVIAALMFSGCAGLSANKTQAVTYPLRGMVPWAGEFLYGVERESTERELMKKRKSQIDKKKRKKRN